MEKGIFVCLDHDDLLKLINSSLPEWDYVPYYLENHYMDVDCGWNLCVLNELDDHHLFHMYMCLKHNKNPEGLV